MLEPIENATKTFVLSGNQKKRIENYGFAWKPIENVRTTKVLRWNKWKTQGNQKFCVGIYKKRQDNTCFAW